MTHFYERNIVEIKEEYTTFLINIITPFLYEGIKSLYDQAIIKHEEFEEEAKKRPNIKSPGILRLFQIFLKDVPSLNNNKIEDETNRIKNNSKCSSWFDDLIRAVIKSNIVLLTFSSSKNKSEIIKEKFHENVNVCNFVHKCYIECARSIYNYPELFWHKFPTLEIKRNQREICNIINTSIKEAIRKILPMELILKEFLKNEYIRDSEYNISNKNNESQYINIKSMIDKDLHNNSQSSNDDDVSDPEDNLLNNTDDLHNYNNHNDNINHNIIHNDNINHNNINHNNNINNNNSNNDDDDNNDDDNDNNDNDNDDSNDDEDLLEYNPTESNQYITIDDENKIESYNNEGNYKNTNKIDENMKKPQFVNNIEDKNINNKIDHTKKVVESLFKKKSNKRADRIIQEAVDKLKNNNENKNEDIKKNDKDVFFSKYLN